ncbi:MAG TPA: hypothetical protein RMH99_04320 [Sandaracinaceae bacterium LLY-WYZ-13_1]|nr:hypothetical protein [Sandaracinaceae bacterium LLY-WYZ-13_1]
MPRRASPWMLVWIAAVGLAACGGEAPAPRAAAADAPTAGDEAAPEPAAPVGPPRSYVADEDTIVVRVDMARVRASSISSDIGSLVRSYPTWQRLLGRSGIDPVRDFDRVLVSAPTAITDRATMVIHHRLSGADVREAVLNMAVAEGEQPAWREVGGFDVVDWPAPTDPPRVVILSGPSEFVVTTPDDLERVIAVASDHRARRRGDETVEPALVLEDGTVATVVAEEMSEYGRSRMRHAPEAFEVVLRDDAEAEGHLRLRARGTYADADAASAAARYYVTQRNEYAGNMMVRAVGLDRPLREATIEAEGNRLDVTAAFTEEEIQRVLGLVALGGLGAGG